MMQSGWNKNNEYFINNLKIESGKGLFYTYTG